jgi:DNA invertase Pin-like site-specific DNA recombinase
MIYAYLRLSTNEDKQKNSFEVQLNEIKQHFHIAKVFKETISGSAELHKRKSLLAMLELLKKDDKVIVLRLDRISRDTVQSGWIRYEIQKKKAELITLENQKKR